jgi:Flp pilus assembly protein TadG
MDCRKVSPPLEHGQSLVEFAISLTILLILVAGLVDAARALFTYLSLRDAAQEGALYASIDPTNNAEIVDRACRASDVLENLDLGENCHEEACNADDQYCVDIDINLTGAACMGATGGVAHGVEVVVNYPNYPLTMPFIGGLIGRENTYTIPISASVIDTIITPSCP